MAKRLGMGLLALVLLLVGVFVALSLRASAMLGERPTARAVALPSPDSTSAARGAHLAQVLGCQSCHGDDLGGKALGDAPPFRLRAPNLTRGAAGLGDRLTPDAVERALRQGIGTDGRWLYAMPRVPSLADADVVALATYIAGVPEVAKPSETVAFTSLGRVLVGAGQIAPEGRGAVYASASAAPPPPADTLAVGAYFVGLTCTHCHGADLRGAPHPDPSAPPGPDLRPAVGWGKEAFGVAVRTGARPSGPAMKPEWMPWPEFAHFTDAEMAGIYATVRDRRGSL